VLLQPMKGGNYHVIFRYYHVRLTFPVGHTMDSGGCREEEDESVAKGRTSSYLIGWITGRGCCTPGWNPLKSCVSCLSTCGCLLIAPSRKRLNISTRLVTLSHPSPPQYLESVPKWMGVAQDLSAGTGIVAALSPF
jgi:hypothetical protein